MKLIFMNDINKLILFLFIMLMIVDCKKHDHSNHDKHIQHKKENEHAQHSDHDEHSGHDEHKDHGSENGHHHEIKNFGKNMAVLDADEKKGIQLSKEAIKTIGLVEKRLSLYFLKKNNVYSVPTTSLIFYENKVGIYLKKNNWYSFYDIQIIKRNKKNAHFVLKGNHTNALLIIKGCSLLRLAHLEAFGASGHGHGH